MQNLIATTFEVVHYIALQAVHYKPLQEVHLSRYNHGQEKLYIKPLDSNVNEGDYIPHVVYLPTFAGINSKEEWHTPAVRNKYIGQGLASNLAHLGRICELAAAACGISQHLLTYMRPSPLLPRSAAAQTDANLSAHLHRLPTPPPYLRRMRLPLAGVEVSDGK